MARWLIALSLLAGITASADVDPMTGRRGKQIIAVIDTGVSGYDRASRATCRGAAIDLTGSGNYDVDGHGTVIQAIIADGIDLNRWCVMPIKWYHNKAEYERSGGNVASQRISTAINMAIEAGAVVINMSLSGDQPSAVERLAIGRALERGIHVVVAAGNEGYDLDDSCRSFPACYGFKDKRFHVVGEPPGLGRRYNHGTVVTDTEDPHYLYLGIHNKGTSIAVGKVSAKLVRSLTRR